MEFLQLRRSQGVMSGSWQPVMGHIQEGETAVGAALRELAEETGYRPGSGLVGLWQLELINTYFMAGEDVVVMSPSFAAQVEWGVEAVLDGGHDDVRWVRRDHAGRSFIWPGQRAAVEHIVEDILLGGVDGTGRLLKIDFEPQ